MNSSNREISLRLTNIDYAKNSNAQECASTSCALCAPVRDLITVRNEWWKDETGFRSGFPGNYTSNTIGLTHNFNSLLQIRPEIG